MDGKDVIYGLRATLNEAKNRGLRNMPIDLVEQHIDQAEKYACECTEVKKMDHESDIESFRALISSGANAIKAAMIINGGSAIALLTFIPKIKQADLVTNPVLLIGALAYFGIGVLLAAISSSLAYFSQRAYHYKKTSFWGDFFTGAAIVIVLLGYASYFMGVYRFGGALGLSQ